MISSRLKFNSVHRALAGAVIFCLSQTASAVEVSPYFHSWGGSLMQAKQAAGMTSATLAFAVTRGNCAFVPNFLNELPEARDYVASGGRLLLSFGGDDGVLAEIACRDENQLFSMMEKLMEDSGSRRFDFDIEGPQLLNTEATARRARVLARLQAKYPDLFVSFSLPGWLRGFNPPAIDLLNTTQAAGVRIDMVNVMSQSFGLENLRTMVVPSTVGQASVMTFQAAANQMASIFQNKTQPQLYAMMGITPMIGKNDDGSTFTLDDARTIADFAKSNGVGLISYWSFQRDRAQATSGLNDLNSFSGVAQSDFQFHSIFKSAGDSLVGTAPAQACNASNWAQGQQYEAGSIVSYPDGKLYLARVTNPGYNPTISTYYWSPHAC
ncbi:MAG: hypothetical protein H7273_03650 [Polaromonas sp.]|nr:hypothetical protein [Polaromonas sp.]